MRARILAATVLLALAAPAAAPTTWFGATTPRFDAGLVANGEPRSAYYEVNKRLR